MSSEEDIDEDLCQEEGCGRLRLIGRKYCEFHYFDNRLEKLEKEVELLKSGGTDELSLEDTKALLNDLKNIKPNKELSEKFNKILKEGTEDADESPAGIAELERLYDSPPHDEVTMEYNFNNLRQAYFQLLQKQRREFVESIDEFEGFIGEPHFYVEVENDKRYYISYSRFLEAIRNLKEKYSEEEEK
ncbi:MAG: hypothetical protein ACFFDN_00065 [Candidatus Hodarchaeota archaeon]